MTEIIPTNDANDDKKKDASPLPLISPQPSPIWPKLTNPTRSSLPQLSTTGTAQGVLHWPWQFVLGKAYRPPFFFVTSNQCIAVTNTLGRNSFAFWVCKIIELSFWRRIFFQILAHPVFKMWIIQKPNKVALWNKQHFEEEKKWRLYSMFKVFNTDICWINIKWGI